METPVAKTGGVAANAKCTMAWKRGEECGEVGDLAMIPSVAKNAAVVETWRTESAARAVTLE
eukprot:4466912-Pyramimonas_sp.AAC.1